MYRSAMNVIAVSGNTMRKASIKAEDVFPPSEKMA